MQGKFVDARKVWAGLGQAEGVLRIRGAAALGWEGLLGLARVVPGNASGSEGRPPGSALGGLSADRRGAGGRGARAARAPGRNWGVDCGSNPAALSYPPLATLQRRRRP